MYGLPRGAVDWRTKSRTDLKRAGFNKLADSAEHSLYAKPPGADLFRELGSKGLTNTATAGYSDNFIVTASVCVKGRARGVRETSCVGLEPKSHQLAMLVTHTR